MNYRHGQILFHALRAMFSHAELVSGAYRSRKMQAEKTKYDPLSGAYEHQARDLTDEEKRDHVLAEMGRHVGIVRDFCEHLPEESDTKETP